MLQAYGRIITKLRWFIIAAWIAIVTVVLLLFPQLQEVVAHQSTTFLPDTSTSMIAGKLANQVDVNHQSKSTVIVAVRDTNKLTTSEKQFFTDKLQTVEQNAADYQVTYVTDAAKSAANLADKFVSKDGTTEIAVVGLSTDITNPNLNSVLDHLHGVFDGAPSGMHVYFTGDVPIQADDIQTSQQAADKTAVVTVVLVLTILLIVFRSLLAPLVTLISIGMSYMVSSGVVALAAQHGLPVSTFTQTFLIAVLFGAGTDYSIILLNRFREELTKTRDRAAALSATLHGVSKTVIFSSLTVLVSFAVLYLANFGLYRSAVGVSIGIFITLVTCMTFIPALMSVIGGGLYWPRKPKPGMEHKPSRIWGWTGTISTRRPWSILLVLLVVLTPIALLFSSARTFDPMLDIPNAPSVDGFHTVATAFGDGQAMPTTIVLKTDGNLRSSEGLATVNNLTKALASSPAVSEVDSATQPVGTTVTDFQLAHQNQQAADGLGKVTSGLSQFADQMSQSSNKGQQSSTALASLASGSGKVTDGAKGLASGASSLATSSTQLGEAGQKLATGLGQVGDSAKQLADGTSTLASSEGQLATATSSLADAIAEWAQTHPGDAATPNWQQIEGLATQVNQGTSQVAQSSGDLAKGMGQLTSSIPALQAGASQLASGNQQVAVGVQRLASGATDLANGSQQVTGGISQFASSMGPMMSGFSKATNGAVQMKDGAQQVQSFLQQSATASDPGFYIPANQVVNNSDLKQAMDAYISPDGHIAKFTVLLKANPYSAEAIRTIPDLMQTANAALLSSPIHSGDLYAGGTTATQANMNDLSNQDFIRTMALVFGAIFILLVLMLRSVLTPLYIMLSLAATYFVTMGIVQTIAIHVVHNPGVSWSVPFFAFLLLVALGVDYSIFLMSRFDEEYRKGLSPVKSMRTAMRTMGNVVFSAALIMAGTFGSMTVTGMATMLQIGLAVVIGLFLYSFGLLAFFLPASAAIIGPAHPWPFKKFGEEEDVVGVRRGKKPVTGEIIEG